MESALSSLKVGATLLCLLILLLGCGENVSNRESEERLRDKAEQEVRIYEDALESGRKTVPVVREFNQAFSSANNFISYHVGGGKPVWNAKAPLYDRYVVTLKVPVTLSEDRRSVIDYGAPEFRIVEVTEITNRGSIRYSEHQMSFGPKEWKVLSEAQFDFSSIGYVMSKDNPVSGFAHVWTEA